jgi:polysaccharide export outer membrane protein
MDFGYSNVRVQSSSAKRVFAAWLVFAAFGSVGCATTPEPNPPGTGWAEYRVGAPDNLEVSILPEPVMHVPLVVRPDGMISIDLIGDVQAAGRTTAEIARDIEKKIGRYKRDASVTVRLVSSLSDTITVLGEVGRPGTFPLTRETRVIEAIALVGGPTQFVSKGNIRVLRAGEDQTTLHYVNLRAIEKGDLSSNLVLQPGDIVFAPPNWLARIGYVLQTILFPFQPVLGAVAMYNIASGI